MRMAAASAGHLLVVTGLFVMLAAPVAEASRGKSLFLRVNPVSSTDISAFTKWTSLFPRYEREKNDPYNGCTDGKRCLPREWDALLEKLQGQPEMKQLQAVNDFFNKNVPYVEDIVNWGVEDYWSTPYEFMARGGDCEDYAIAKYFSLKRLGIPESRMRLMIVQDFNLGGEMHAILEVRVNGTPYILDNQAAQVISEAEIFHYQPLYAINQENWWAYQ